MRIIKANNRSGYKRISLLSLKLAVFYAVALAMPANHYSNRFLATLTLYIWLSQEYVRKACRFNWHSVFLKKMQFVCNFSMNQATSLVFIIAPLAAVLAPELPWLPGFVTLFPILCRFTQCFVVGTGEQYLNSIKFTLNLIGFGYSVVDMPMHSHYWRIAAAVYSFYWDVVKFISLSSEIGNGRSASWKRKSSGWIYLCFGLLSEVSTISWDAQSGF
jgi:hypothetical protein